MGAGRMGEGNEPVRRGLGMMGAEPWSSGGGALEGETWEGGGGTRRAGVRAWDTSVGVGGADRCGGDRCGGQHTFGCSWAPHSPRHPPWGCISPQS